MRDTILEVQDPAFDHPPDELSFSITKPDAGPDDDGVMIHPWDRSDCEDFATNPREVAIVVGNIAGFFATEGDFSDTFRITIVDREQFVSGLLKTFPELKRA